MTYDLATLRRMPKKAFGQLGEAFWAQAARLSGFEYFELSDWRRDKPPVLHGPEQLVLPDYELVHPRMPSWVSTLYLECKAKRGPVMYHEWHQWRQGIQKRHYEHYHKLLAKKPGSTMLVGVFEAFEDEKATNPGGNVWSGRILCETLERLGEPYEGYSTMDDTVFWPRTRFEVIAKLTPEQFFAIVNRVPTPDLPNFEEPILRLLGVAETVPSERDLFNE